LGGGASGSWGGTFRIWTLNRGWGSASVAFGSRVPVSRDRHCAVFGNIKGRRMGVTKPDISDSTHFCSLQACGTKLPNPSDLGSYLDSLSYKTPPRLFRLTSMSPPPMKPKHDSPVPSITPQRKHRKLLKDGSGTEVWPEAIEKVFVQGLKEYWDSPYATYSQSRGRSRWRNQFLVDYLHKHGVERSKKQVASHIQVLRNMWKGEPGV